MRAFSDPTLRGESERLQRLDGLFSALKFKANHHLAFLTTQGYYFTNLPAPGRPAALLASSDRHHGPRFSDGQKIYEFLLDVFFEPEILLVAPSPLGGSNPAT